jgi:hypothetical protein
MREAFAQCVASCIDDVPWCIEIWLSNFKMNDVAPFCFERFRFHKYFKRGLRAESRHAFGEPEFMCFDHAT